MTRHFVLTHQTARSRAMQYLAEAPQGWEVRISPPKRSGDQNAKLHALLGDISQQIEWAGERRDIDTWKRLLTAAWFRATKRNVQLLPALDGYGVDIVYCPTSRLTREECCELIDFVEVWAVDHGLELDHA